MRGKLVSSTTYQKKPLTLLTFYLLFVLVGGALLAPCLHGQMQWLAGHFPVLQHWAESPFHRYVNRAMQGLAVLGLIPFARRINANTWKEFGLARPVQGLRNLGRGALLGLVSMILITGPALMWEVRMIKTRTLTPAGAVENMVQAALSGLVVGLVEEILFRGALFNALRRVHHWIVALGASSLVYALLHFVQKPASPEEITWSSGFVMVGRMFGGFGNMELLLPGFLVLSLAGCILGLLYQDTGTLYASIGLHASWVFCIKTYLSLTYTRPGTSEWFWGSKKLIDGWMGFFVLALLLCGLILWRQRRRKDAAN